jgi:hypothetical protein
MEAHVGVSRRIFGEDFHFVANVAARKYETDFAAFPSRVQTRFLAGLSYSPGDVPLALW